ncbi:hypothetical protein GAMM_350020 [Gammaproteobacteria bacterium]
MTMETEKDKEMLKIFLETCDRMSKSMGQPDKKDHSIYRLPKRFKLTEKEKKELPAKYEEYLRIKDNAINLVKKHIKRLEDEDPTKHDWIIYKLKIGLGVLERGKQAVIERGGVSDLMEWLERFQRGRRPGFGLNRGFGDFLNAPPYSKEPWTGEIMDAVNKIEDYFNDM